MSRVEGMNNSVRTSISSLSMKSSGRETLWAARDEREEVKSEHVKPELGRQANVE